MGAFRLSFARQCITSKAFDFFVQELTRFATLMSTTKWFLIFCAMEDHALSGPSRAADHTEKPDAGGSTVSVRSYGLSQKQKPK